MLSRAAPMYRIFRRATGDADQPRAVVIAMIALAFALVAVGVVRVARQHEVLELGFQLARESDLVRQEREVRRRLELERATLTAPERIRHLATELGMTPVAPDKIRVIAQAHPLAENP